MLALLIIATSIHFFTLPSSYLGIGIGGVVDNTYTEKYNHNQYEYNYGNNYDINILAGHHFINWFALETEINYAPRTIYNNNAEDSRFYNLLINGVFKYPNFGQHIPFAKIGMGYMNQAGISTDNSDKSKYNGIAYQVAIGYEYAFTVHHSMLASYNYSKTFQHNEIYNEYKGKYTLGYSDIKLQYEYHF